MKIALIGATGFVGSALLDEMLARDHTVTTLTRHPESVGPRPQLIAARADVRDTAQLTRALRGHDAVVSAFNPGWSDPDIHDNYLRGTESILAAMSALAGTRLLFVGGAGSLYVAPGVQLVDTDGFPQAYLAGARAARTALERLRQAPGLEWTFLSPPALLAPGARTGRYRLGSDQLLMAGEAPAGISVADLAVALVDELESPRHRQARFTVAAA